MKDWAREVIQELEDIEQMFLAAPQIRQDPQREAISVAAAQPVLSMALSKLDGIRKAVEQFGWDAEMRG